MTRSHALIFVAALSAVTHPAAAHEARPMRLLVGLPSGSAADGAARALADGFKDALNRAVVVDNRPGAGGRLAAELLKASAPDGSTLLVAPMGTTIFFPVFASKLNYDPWKDFAQVSQVATVRLAFAVAAGMPPKSMKEYVAWARADASRTSFGSAGAGTPPHFLGLMIGRASHVELTHVAYKGGPLLVTDMLGGHVPAGVGTITDFAELHRGGKLRMLAIGGSSRVAALPEVPTFRDAGYDLDGMTWLGLHAPAATPSAIVNRVAAAVAAGTRREEIQARFAKLGFELVGSTPEQFLRLMQAERAKWEPVIRASGFKDQ